MNATCLLRRRAALTVSTVTAALALTACGSAGIGRTETPGGAGASAEMTARHHNGTDVTFAQHMIMHHRMAIAMSDMAASHGASNQVKALAVKIKKAQQPEIETLSRWLRTWGQKPPQGMEMDHGKDSSPMAKMMHHMRMDDLDGASGKAFDTMFLNMMIMHHRGAVDMARMEQKEGAHEPARKLAGEIVTAQTAEIAQMEKMLAAAGSAALHSGK
ncbi:DUF305 domain-containing protein [Streptomyces sp. NPDC018833]|uniref:DUF305 domain-containing protein n=1 Tax=Streptomyces sp. NPDC018833 TaxID=3365053 RepID=UPI0037893C9C